MKGKFKELQLPDKVNWVILSIIRITLFIAIAGALLSSSWTILFVSTFTFILTFVPSFFESHYKIDIPAEFEIITVLFIYATLFLGEVHGFYTKFWWWDLILHTGSAIALGFIGFTILYILYKGDKIKASPRAIALFSFFFALGIGALWEIFEFAMDQLFGFNMQKSGLVDTMVDLIVDSAGALLAATLGYLYLKKDELFIVNRIMTRFVKNNPNLFK